jgi:hypothetical protein
LVSFGVTLRWDGKLSGRNCAKEVKASEVSMLNRLGGANGIAGALSLCVLEERRWSVRQRP